MLDLFHPCTKRSLGSFKSEQHYVTSASGIIAVLESCGLTYTQAWDLFQSGPEGIYAYYMANDKAVCSEWLLDMCKPTLTAYNRVGKFFAKGTTCDCCLGYRIAIAIAAWPVFFMLGKYYASF